MEKFALNPEQQAAAELRILLKNAHGFRFIKTVRATC